MVGFNGSRACVHKQSSGCDSALDSRLVVDTRENMMAIRPLAYGHLVAKISVPPAIALTRQRSVRVYSLSPDPLSDLLRQVCGATVPRASQ